MYCLTSTASTTATATTASIAESTATATTAATSTTTSTAASSAFVECHYIYVVIVCCNWEEEKRGPPRLERVKVKEKAGKKSKIVAFLFFESEILFADQPQEEARKSEKQHVVRWQKGENGSRITQNQKVSSAS